MTWISDKTEVTPECDSVLGLQPKVYAALLDLMNVAWAITDPELLQLCRLQIALTHGTTVEGAADRFAEVLGELEDWRSSSSFTPRERAALDYLDQFVIDQNGITDGQKEEIGRHFTEEELVAFVQATNLSDSYLRVLTLLDVPFDPELRRPDDDERRRALQTDRDHDQEEPSIEDDGPVNHNERLVSLTAPAFFDSRARFAAIAMLETGVDDITSEFVRLRNANHQRCQLCMSVRRASVLPSKPDERDPMAVVRMYEQSTLPERQKVLLRLADAFLTYPAGFGDDARAQTKTHYTSEQIVEILLKLAYWSQNRTSIALGMDDAINDEALTAFDYDEGGDFVLLTSDQAPVAAR